MGFRYKGVYKDLASTIARDEFWQTLSFQFTGQTILHEVYYPSIGYTFQPKGHDAMYEDINHDGNINYYDIVYLGNSNPKFTGGLEHLYHIKVHGNLQPSLITVIKGFD